MSLTGKRRAVGAVLLAVAVWPGIHFAWASRAGFDPWELFGFAMYAVPLARVQVAVDGELPGHEAPVHLRADDPRLRAFARRRTLLGALAPVEPFARDLLRDEPRLRSVTVRLRRIRLDAETARLVAEDEAVRVARP